MGGPQALKRDTFSETDRLGWKPCPSRVLRVANFCVCAESPALRRPRLFFLNAFCFADDGELNRGLPIVSS
jgi:hypothetical protein